MFAEKITKPKSSTLNKKTVKPPQYKRNLPFQLKGANCTCIQRTALGTDSFSFMKNQNDAIARPAMHASDTDDIFSLAKYDIHDLKNAVAETTLQRDHIIPYKTIMKFTDEVCKHPEPADETDQKKKAWFKNGVAKMTESGLKDRGRYYDVGDRSLPLHKYDDNEFNTRAIYDSIDQDNFSDNSNDKNKFEVIHKAISWMPGNIMIAPAPKMNDAHSGDDFDNTCKNVIPDTNYKILSRTYVSMINFLNHKKEEDAQKALDDLNTIILWDGPYAFRPEQWLLDQRTMQWKNNLKNEEDTFVEIQKTIEKAETVSLSMKTVTHRVDHLTHKEYRRVKNETSQSKLALQQCIAILQQYYNSPIHSYIERSIRSWQTTCQTLERHLDRVACKYMS